MTRSLSAAIAQAKGEEVLLDPRHDAPHVDPTMHVYCPIHSARPGHDGGRTGPVAASFGKDEYGRAGYQCWHCAYARWLEQSR